MWGSASADAILMYQSFSALSLHVLTSYFGSRVSPGADLVKGYESSAAFRVADSIFPHC
jgi:hypothetical protein